jgi:two-component system cell cycle sensor histidine kinase/response regulator CckA
MTRDNQIDHERLTAEVEELRERLRELDEHLTAHTGATAGDTLPEICHRSLFSALDIGIVYQRPDGQIIAANPAACGVLGLDLPALLGRTSSDTKWEARDASGTVLEGERHPSMVAIRTGEPVRDVLMQVLNPELGEHRWLEVTAIPEFRRGEAAPFRVFTSFTDVTERRRAEHTLRESEERFRSIVAASPMGMHLYELQENDRLVFIGANPAADRLLGTDNSRFLGLTIEEAFPPLANTEIPKRYRIAARDGLAWSTDLVNYEHEEIKGAFKVHAFQTAPGFMVAVFLEITETLRTQERLRRSEARYRQFFEEDLTGDYLATADGRFLDVNPAFVQIFGFSDREHALRTSAAALYPKATDRERFLSNLRACGELRYHEQELRRTDGTPVFVIENASAQCDEQGELAIIKGYLFDITAHKKTEEQLRHAQKMEAIGRLAGGVAHDFNNLLQAMVATIEAVPSSPEDAQGCHDRQTELANLIRRGSALTQQLLLFARKEVPARESLDLNQVVAGVIPMLRRLVRENIRFEVTLDSGPIPILGDARQLEQVLVNLVLNAFDAMPAGGQLTLATSTAGDCAHVQVIDTGIGIPEYTRRRIFEPFFTTKGPGQGSGLGLPVALGIVESHGGRIEIDSTVGVGSTFRVVLPRAQADVIPPTTPLPQIESTPRGNGESVLLVEDEQVTRESLTQIIKILGYSVTSAANGREAQETAGRSSCDILLTDFVLPDITGIELARFLRVSRPELKVVLMSGYAEEGVVAQGLGAGEFRFIQKPFGLAAIANELREVLQR